MILGAGLSMLAGVTTAIFAKSLYSTIWKMRHPAQKTRMKAREQDFLARVMKHRCDEALPGTGVDAMPTDDPYAAKVKTLSDYRKWLREQQEAHRAKVE